jgi:hypothetical protein
MSEDDDDYDYDDEDEVPDLARVSLPVTLRYRAHVLRTGWIFVALLLVAAIIAIIALRHPIFGAPPTVLAIGCALVMIWMERHIRRLDHFRLEAHALVLNYRDGRAERLPLTPGVEFTVGTEHVIDTLVMTTAKDDHARQRFIAFDLLHLPAGRSFHELCDFLNQLCSGVARAASTPSGARPSGAPTIRRRLHWYRNPQPLSRAGFQLRVLMVLAVCIGIYFGLSEIWAHFGIGGDRWVAPFAKLALSYLIVHPVFKFLAVARLRDMGEAATHRNVGGLLWKDTAGPLRLFFTKGEAFADQAGQWRD